MQKQLSCAVIQDFSGHGRCSLTVALPILASNGICASCAPTAVFSNHSGYDSFYFKDLTPDLPSFLAEWKKLNLSFDGVYTGFLGSEAQIDIVERFLSDFSVGKIIIDPVMGDDGKIYSTYTSSLCKRMSELVTHADVITPNITEACILTDTPYPAACPSDDFLSELANRIMKTGAKNAVITGISSTDTISNLVVTPTETRTVSRPRAGHSRPGTGDVFASVLTAELLKGSSLADAVSAAADFVAEAIVLADRLDLEPNAGVPFELLL